MILRMMLDFDGFEMMLDFDDCEDSAGFSHDSEDVARFWWCGACWWSLVILRLMLDFDDFDGDA